MSIEQPEELDQDLEIEGPEIADVKGGTHPEGIHFRDQGIHSHQGAARTNPNIAHGNL